MNKSILIINGTCYLRKNVTEVLLLRDTNAMINSPGFLTITIHEYLFI